jgi:acetoin utilization deacetylase AcuC-like enzyme
MIFFLNPTALLSLHDHGIEIPLTDGRILKITELLKELKVPVETNFDDIHLKNEDLKRVHTDDYLAKLFGSEDEKRQAIFQAFELINPDGTFHRYNPKGATRPLSEIVEHVLKQTTGTMKAVKEALASGEAFHLGGGYHHAMSFGGRGFCLINDIVIAARWAQKRLNTKSIWIIDVDAHKGDGTAELTEGDSSIRTLSIHMKKGWPLDNGLETGPWFIPSDIEIGINTGQEKDYNSRLKDGLLSLEELDQEKPDLAIVVQGADPYEKDELPSTSLLKLTKGQLLERDLLVYNFLKERKIPQAYVMAGGYGEYSYEIYCQFISEILKTQ